MNATTILVVIAIPAMAISILWILAVPLQFIVAAIGIYWLVMGLYTASRIFW